MLQIELNYRSSGWVVYEKGDEEEKEKQGYTEGKKMEERGKGNIEKRTKGKERRDGEEIRPVRPESIIMKDEMRPGIVERDEMAKTVDEMFKGCFVLVMRIMQLLFILFYCSDQCLFVVTFLFYGLLKGCRIKFHTRSNG